MEVGNFTLALNKEKIYFLAEIIERNDQNRYGWIP